jgi:hypothetical protein
MGRSSFSLGFVTVGRALDDFTLASGRKYEIYVNDHKLTSQIDIIKYLFSLERVSRT